MGKTVAQLLSEISSRELAEWQAYDQIEPFGELRADLRAGIVASTIAEVYRDRKKRGRPFRPDEFMPRFDAGPNGHGEAPAQTWQQQLGLVEAMNVALGGRDLRKR